MNEMAVAASDTVSSALTSCLANAIDIYNAVQRQSDTNLARLFETLVSSVQCVKDLGPVPGNVSLIKFACIQIADDLLVHFQRLDGGPVDVCGVWGRDDLSALRGRLGEVLGLCQDVLPNLRDICRPVLAGSQIHEPEYASIQPTEKTIDKGPEAQNVESTVGVPAKKPPRLAPAGLINNFILESLAYKSMHDRESQVTEAHAKTLDWIFDNSLIYQSLRRKFRDSFTAWLNGSELSPIYWITGKPGSGKSTLVRYLLQHPVALHHLRKWAGKKTISTVGFFFWTSGSMQQRSQTGLLRYLLHQLLSSDPNLVEKAFPSLWAHLRQLTTKERVNFALDWAVGELQAAFYSLLDAALPQTNICLFIDGLDEFEGDHMQIIDFFKGLTMKHDGSLKLCLSSRPWDVFERAFGSSVPNTKLQDLSYEDMYRYALDTLKTDPRLRRLLKQDQDQEATRSLLTSIVEQADGVFLWVRLAVERMLADHKRRNNMTTLSAEANGFESLRTTLDSLPTELDDLFAKLLLEDQTSSDITQTATLYQLTQAREIVADFIRDESANSLTVWELAFALLEDDDGLALNRQVVKATDEEIEARCQTTIRSIKERFAGLLNVHVIKPVGNMRFADKRQSVAGLVTTSKVVYIHRTVRDWLVQSGASRLASFQDLRFDSHLRLLRSYVLRLKHPLEEIEHHRRLNEWYPDIALAMTHARYIVNDDGKLQRKFLNEMDKTISWLWLTKESDETDHWAKSTFGSYEVRMKAPPIHNPFLCLAVKFGLTTYVCAELANMTQNVADGDDGSTPLLAYAIEFLCSRNKTIFPTSSPSLVKYLLSHQTPINPGPNHKYKHFETHQPLTPWVTVLRHLRDAKRRGWIEYYDINPEGTARWVEIVREFVKYADVEAIVPRDTWDPEISALGVIDMLVRTYGSAEMESIKLEMKKSLESWQKAA
ncbi:uncharacterized protein FIESC28_02883 [Fusarium coffeatum]|uniref:Uncharacterized protein n=1 Tax=Fusarium coffeatum TaxID=231269 RepID=A0A366S4Z5_9HYPO|nr:uncharacterized protein FIESC28_02883 [Fusarium coffeatum]RBR24393.1 hypothetical protein FIESC28_02883 [Fusarium coffeatum]